MPEVNRDGGRPGALPYWQTTDGGKTCRLYQGQIIAVLQRLPSGIFQSVITSPPYWRLRDYEGGPDEIGQERTPEQYVNRLVQVFREIRRTLRDDGTVWLNLGDTYARSGDGSGFPSGSLVGVPWRVALALQADGWLLRQEIIWHKTNPMTESIRNRCSRAHEHVFLLTKSTRYFCDMGAIREKGSGCDQQDDEFMSSNKRTVWTVGIATYPGAHFAVYPPKLIEPMILAGTSAKGCCVRCRAPWLRVMERVRKPTRPGRKSKLYGGPNSRYNKSFDPQHRNEFDGKKCGNRDPLRHVTETKTVGWTPGCRCWGENVMIAPDDDPNEVLAKRVSQPCLVFDPFVGSGTTPATCLGLGRWCWAADLKESYLRDLCVPRVEGVLYDLPDLAHLAP